MKQKLQILGMAVFLLLLALVSQAQENECASGTNHLEVGEALVLEGNYAEAVMAFDCAIENNPEELAAYRGKIEALLLSGRFSDAMLTYASVKVDVVPVISDALPQILAYYETALAAEPENIRLLSAYSFAQWYNFNSEGAQVTLETLLSLEPDNLYGLVLRGNNSFFLGNQEQGEADFERAFELAGDSADIHYMKADGYLYGLGNLEASLAEVTIAHELGLDTPRTDAMFATCYFYLGEVETALPYYASHIERTSQTVIEAGALERGESLVIFMQPGEQYQIEITAEANENLVIAASSAVASEDNGMGVQNTVDTIMILLAPDGSIVTGNDDNVDLNAGFEFTVAEAGTYTLILSSFEGAGFGDVSVSRN